MILNLASWGFAFTFLALAWLFARGTRKFPGLWTRLPRHRILGEILGVACLWWAGQHACGMLEGGLAKFRIIIRLLVPVVAIVAYSRLDYLFARALGGFFTLMAILLLHQAFVVHLPARAIYSTTCYIIGIAGLYLLGAPWRFRDILEKTKDCASWRRTLTAISSALAIVLIVWPLLG